MEQRFAKRGDHQICFWDTGSGERPILFLHGNSAAKNSFESQFAESHLAPFRLIAMDLPGHGGSSWLSDYTMTEYIGAVRTIIDELGLTDVLLVGHSLGGNIAVEASSEIPQLAGVLLFGAAPLTRPPAVDRAFLPHPSAIAFFTENLTDQDYLNWSQTCFRTGFKTPEHFVSNIKQTDPNVRGSLMRHLMALNYRDEVQCILESEIPVAILHGEYENTISYEYLASLKLPAIWRGEVVVVKGAGHSPHIETPGDLAKLVAQFARDLD